MVDSSRGEDGYNSLSLHRDFLLWGRDRQDAVRRQARHHIDSQMVPGKRILPHEVTGNKRAVIVFFILVLSLHYDVIPDGLDRDLVGGELVHVDAYLELVPVCCDTVASVPRAGADKGTRDCVAWEHCRGHGPVGDDSIRISGEKRIHCVKL